MIKRKTPILRIPLGKNMDYSFLDNYPEVKTKTYDEVVKSISLGLKNNKKIVDVFNIDNSDFTISLKKENWKIHLSASLDYYIQLEDYDRCIEIRELIKII